MADGLPPTSNPSDGEPPRKAEPPPPLTDIRVKGPGAKGLNKPAILIAAGGGLALILVLASNGMSSNTSRKAADVKPMMSDPARPEMAQGAVKSLPATYEQAAARQAALLPAHPPQLGPALPGDIAAFAPRQVNNQIPPTEPGWRPSGAEGGEPPTPAAQEAQQADRSTLFFALREKPEPTQSPTGLTPTKQTGLFAAKGPTGKPSPSNQPDRALFPGAVIPASLVTEITSENPGPVIAQVTQTIYDSLTGRVPLIPQGARLIGDYKSSTRYGQSRIAILWSRLIMPNGEEIALDEAATDPSGAAGVSGKVDNHWGEVFGAAALGTLINIGVATTEDPQLTYNGVGAITRSPVDTAIAEGVERSASIVTNRVVDRALAIPPTIRVEAGKRIAVIVTRRTGLYPSG